jgi:hypothetical protein
MTITKYIILLSLCLPSLAKADICFKTFEEDTIVAAAIFVGKVVKIEESQFWHRGPKTIFTFEIKESFKGLWRGLDYISIIGPIHGCCNEHFINDSTFLVFAYGDGESSTLLWTNDCSNTGLLSKQMDIYQKLGNGVKHVANTEFLEYINKPEIKRDSLLHTIDSLNSQINDFQKESTRFVVFSILLTIIPVILLILIINMRKKK